MAMSYVEEIAKAYFEYIGGYIVSQDMPYQDKNSLKKVKGWKDIDIALWCYGEIRKNEYNTKLRN